MISEVLEGWTKTDGSWSIDRGEYSYHLLSRPAHAGGMKVGADEWMCMSIKDGIETERYVLGICAEGVAIDSASILIRNLEADDEDPEDDWPL